MLRLYAAAPAVTGSRRFLCIDHFPAADNAGRLAFRKSRDETDPHVSAWEGRAHIIAEAAKSISDPLVLSIYAGRSKEIGVRVASQMARLKGRR